MWSWEDEGSRGAQCRPTTLYQLEVQAAAEMTQNTSKTVENVAHCFLLSLTAQLTSHRLNL